jgi:diguanylate cyclase (GGDEF)-like protein
MAARGGEHAPAGRLLIVDDSPDNLEILGTRLRFRGYAVETAAGGREALARVARRPPDLILLDVMMPDLDGFEVARRIKRDPSLPFIPIILVTARDSTEDKVAGLDAGADDYLTKPINFPELEARVRSMLRIKELQDELGEKNRELEQLSISDGLTGLFNHRHLQDVVHEEFERARRTGEPLSVVMLDLDHFKRVNDLYGHPAGDRVLQDLAEILRHTAREIDKLGRYGGEEFLAVLPDTEPEAAAIFAERVRERVAHHLFPVGRGEPLRLTVSCGTATYPHPGVYNPWTLVQRADQAMYAAKAAGRNRIARYNQLAA